MAIVKKGQPLHPYPIMAIQPDALQILTKDNKSKRLPIPLKLFDSFCHLAGYEISCNTLISPAMQAIFDHFCGALATTDFYGGIDKAREAACREMHTLLEAARHELNELPSLLWWPQKRHHERHLWDEINQKISSHKRRYWEGWPVENRLGIVQYLPLAPMYLTHGREFTETFYEQLRLRAEGFIEHYHHHFNKLITYITSHSMLYPEKTFQDPIGLYNLFKDFIKHDFKDSKSTDRNLPSRKKCYNKFISQVERCFIESGIWSIPIRPLPNTDAKAVPGNSSHIKESGGLTVREKLITTIPLEVSHSQAIEILFFQIKEDLRVIKTWAEIQMSKFMENFAQRKGLAKLGVPITKGYGWTKQANLENVCATFEKYTYDCNFPEIVRHYNRKNNTTYSARDMSLMLGIPNTSDLYPFQLGLIIEHPKITTTFLTGFQLKDKNGNQTGYFPEGGHNYIFSGEIINLISGKKSRKGRKYARQKFPVSAKAALIMENVISITEQARQHFKKNNNENSRKLFLASPIAASLPIIATIPQWNRSTLSKPCMTPLINQFRSITNKSEQQTKEYLRKISPSTVRASRAMEAYIDDGDSSLLSEILGHQKEISELLSHYIPDAFLDYFESRDVRLFHKAVICHALKDSPYLMKASNFESMEQLSEFLKNHALNELSSDLIEPNKSIEQQIMEEGNEILIRLGIGCLSALLSLEKSVKESDGKRPLDEDAYYWSNVARLVRKEIEDGYDPELKRKLAIAVQEIDTTQLDDLIYAT
ncbi:hypothetical protein SAMN04489798_3074 [Pseudomonas arsenicoxydans]|uniref:Uncharacterized protein n=2 Tax=Pseudomonas arsenicoxydans TaxID=702115 RepID=A0A1H0JY28_9PSED|nr:hypothetical protein SAMN04489798_3074 [Pseudomonas arsenicoxydans]